ncbi:leucine-rich repeat domain-containing protein [Emergencia sp.]|uniref:leucine-rich repeat domain-containing protein n=1 Tax=Emergencia sp. TaxID=1926557 RepID=UPI003AF0EDDC
MKNEKEESISDPWIVLLFNHLHAFNIGNDLCRRTARLPDHACGSCAEYKYQWRYRRKPAKSCRSRTQKSRGVPDYSGIHSLTVTSSKLNETDFNFICEKMPNLQNLDLSSTGVSGNLSQLSGLTDLMILDLWSTKVSGDLSSLSNLTKMKKLNLSANDNLTGDLVDLENMKVLEELNIGSKQITGKLSDIKNHQNLKKLTMDHTQLTGALSDLSDLDSDNPKLDYLNLGGTQVSGTLNGLNWTKVKDLYLTRTKVSGELKNLEGLKALERLEIAATGFGGDLQAFSALKNLKILNIGLCTGLNASFDNLSQLQSLENLQLSLTGVSGSLDALGALPKLSHITIDSIETSGELNELEAFKNLSGDFPKLSSLSLTINLPPITFDGGTIAVKAPTMGGTALAPSDPFSSGTYNPTSGEVIWNIPQTSSGKVFYSLNQIMTVGKKDNVSLMGGSVQQPYTVTPKPSPSPSPSGRIITASAGEHGTITPDGMVWVSYGSDKTFQFVPEDGYKVKDVVIDGESVGPISSYTFKTITKSHTIDVTFELEETPADRLIAGVEATTIKASSQAKKGKMIIRWKKSWGYKVDCFQIFRSTKKNSGFGKKPFFTTKSGTKNMYTNTKQLKKGTRYYYKIRGVRVIDGQTIYTKWSNKAYRIAK